MKVLSLVIAVCLLFTSCYKVLPKAGTVSAEGFSKVLIPSKCYRIAAAYDSRFNIVQLESVIMQRKFTFDGVSNCRVLIPTGFATLFDFPYKVTQNKTRAVLTFIDTDLQPQDYNVLLFDSESFVVQSYKDGTALKYVLTEPEPE